MIKSCVETYGFTVDSEGRNKGFYKAAPPLKKGAEGEIEIKK